VIKDGLAATDRVIVNGLMRARAGVKVNAQEQGTASPPAATDKPRGQANEKTGDAAGVKTGSETKAD
jgi:hypothetical protein